MHLRLREATAALHLRVEEQLHLLDPDLTLDRYRGLLRAFYGYYEPLEPRMAAAAATTPPLGFALVRRTPLIERDLTALGASQEDLAALQRCAELPTITLPATLAGCLYVVEGAALGGQVISKALKRQFGMSEHNGASFFAGEGPRTASRWTAVLGWIEALAAAQRCGDTIIEAACETFGTIASWFEREQERHE